MLLISIASQSRNLKKRYGRLFMINKEDIKNKRLRSNSKHRERKSKSLIFILKLKKKITSRKLSTMTVLSFMKLLLKSHLCFFLDG